MNRIVFLRGDRSALIHRFADDVEHPSHDSRSDGHRDGLAGVDDVVAAFETFAGAHGDGAHPVITEMLLDFEREPGGFAQDLELNGECVVDRGELVGKLDVHDRADDLNNFAFIHDWVLRFAISNLQFEFEI